MNNRFCFQVGIVLLLASCGDDVREPEVLDVEALPLTKFAEARGMSAAEPKGPNKHYRLVGDLVFYQADQEIPQEGELWIGGTSRMRFSMGVGTEYPNVFLLADPENCWVRIYKEEFKTYDSLELWRETLIRWHTLRFPWGWQDAELKEFTLETELGILTLEVDADLLPSRISLGDSHVALSDWKAASNGSALYPMHWDWTYEGGRRVEDFTSIHDRALLVDSAFTPKTAKRDFTYLVNPENEFAAPSEHLDFLRIGWQSVGLGEWMDSSSGAPGIWYEHQGERRYVFAPGVENQLGAKVLEERDWLVWSTMQDLTQDDAMEYLSSILLQLNATVDGELWAHIPEQGIANRRVFVLPVIRK